MMDAGSRHSVALALLVTLMVVATSHYMMSNKSSTTSTGPGSGVVVSGGLCNGSTIDGKCLIIAPSYGGDHVDLDMQNLFDTMVEYDSGENSRRALAAGNAKPIDVTDAVNSNGQVCKYQNGQRYTCHLPKGGHVQKCPKSGIYRRDCFGSS